MGLARRDAPRLKTRLDGLMAAYDAAFLGSDPLGLVHAYPRAEDREAAAFFAAALAFGNAASVRASVGRALGRLGDRPAERLRAFDPRRDAALFAGVVHRWVGPRDLAGLARAAGAALREAGSLGALFLAGYDPGAPTLLGALARFRSALLARAPGGIARSGKGLRYLLPDPAGPSACKRLHLFARWMVRPADGLDLGLWRGPRPGQLLVPLDTHIARIGGLLGLTDRRTPDRRMAEEITASLRLLDPADPVRYDFAISRLGILRRCPRRRDERLCAGCPLRDACRHWRGVPPRRKRAARAARADASPPRA